MNNMQFDPNGGDLGRASHVGAISAQDFAAVVPHVAHILQELHISKLSQLPFKYGFELLLVDKEGAKMALPLLKTLLPPNVSFYETNGQALFDIRGASGGVATRCICYLYTHERY